MHTLISVSKLCVRYNLSKDTIVNIYILYISVPKPVITQMPGTTQARTQTSAIHGELKSSSKPSLVGSHQRGATHFVTISLISILITFDHIWSHLITFDDNILNKHLHNNGLTREVQHIWWKISLISISIIRCAHCLPDCESTYYTSSVSATPLRRSSAISMRIMIDYERHLIDYACMET